MTLVADWTTIPVHGKWERLDGTAESGRVTFVPTGGVFIDAASQTVVMGSTFVSALDVNGEITTTLPATNDPDVTGQPFVYTVTAELTTGTTSFLLSVPFDTVGTLELASVTPATDPGPPPATYVQSINGHSGVLTLTDIEGTGTILLNSTNAATAGTAINTAIAALPTFGGTILIPAGTWTLDTAVNINKTGVIIRGVSAGATLLQFNGSTVPIAFKMADTTQRHGVFRDFRLESTADGVGTAMDLSYFTNHVVSGVRIGNTGFSPNVGVVYGTNAFYNAIRDCRIQVKGSSSIGINYSAGNSNVATNVRILGDASTTGVLVTSHSIELERIDIESASLIGIDVTATGHETLIEHPYIEAIATGVRVASGVKAVSILGGFIASCTTANITDNTGGTTSFKVYNCRVNFNPFNQ